MGNTNTKEDLNLELLKATMDGNVIRATDLLKKGANINVNDDKMNPLYAAVLFDKEQMVEFLLANGSDLSHYPDLFVKTLTQTSNPKIMTMLLEHTSLGLPNMSYSDWWLIKFHFRKHKDIIEMIEKREKSNLE